MIHNPIYEPKGKAKEYGNYAINIYTGCPHRCYYCFAPNVLHKAKEVFHNCVAPRENIVEAVSKQVEREGITGKLIHLCFTCDPYPKDCDSTVTREIIKILKDSGNNVQILTKNGIDALRDFDLLDDNDWFGVTFAGYSDNEMSTPPGEEKGAGTPNGRKNALIIAHELGIKTWVSAEPVINPNGILDFIKNENYVDLWKIGKMNYHPSNIEWGKFGKEAEALLKSQNKAYYIKESLRAEMEKENV